MLVNQLLKAAQIEYTGEQEFKLTNVSLFVENILSMCVKEAVTNVVKHSQAFSCHISVEQSKNGIKLTVKDDGIGIPSSHNWSGSGLHGMRERLEFVNGSLEVVSDNGTAIIMSVPNDVKQRDEEEYV